jgi:hypothetical protein
MYNANFANYLRVRERLNPDPKTRNQEASQLLSCEKCHQPDGSMAKSTILMSKCPAQNYKTEGGKIACDPSLPPGHYHLTCDDCRVDSGKLSCQCLGYPPPRRSSIAVGECTAFREVHGALKCEEGTDILV